ncbi:MAG: hypothetical protein E7272_07855 [Pseudobutyrivibrio ruminis]|uniref:Uncharacterized protein n=1 Tax=Pseudobutyrivibrio ruminis TaxID=46206 RepID=A0A927U9T5_9FIRM|nr:hypothetical protein [Pseudobutyrivibrio ruminis]
MDKKRNINETIKSGLKRTFPYIAFFLSVVFLIIGIALMKNGTEMVRNGRSVTGNLTHFAGIGLIIAAVADFVLSVKFGSKKLAITVVGTIMLCVGILSGIMFAVRIVRPVNSYDMFSVKSINEIDPEYRLTSDAIGIKKAEYSIETGKKVIVRIDDTDYSVSTSKELIDCLSDNSDKILDMNNYVQTWHGSDGYMVLAYTKLEKNNVLNTLSDMVSDSNKYGKQVK